MSAKGKSISFFLSMFILLSLSCGLQAGAPALLTRQQAVDALLDPGSGVSLDLTDSAVWSPFADFGFGSGFEGLLPVGSTVSPFIDDDPDVSVLSDSYFFWIDDAPAADFAHSVRFVLVDAANLLPTVGNGGIVISNQQWWPVVTPFAGSPMAYFENDISRATFDPAGFGNLEGHIAGPANTPDELIVLPDPLLPLSPPAAPAAPNNACGLIINGHSDVRMGNNTRRMEQDLKNHYGVNPNRIVRANGHNPATIAQICTAIDNLCKLTPACDKIYIRMSSHGSPGGKFSLSADPAKFISAADLCNKFKKLAKKGVPICLVISSCYSGGLLDANNWNFPAGSSIITTADDSHTSWGGTWVGGINESAYPHAFSQCLNDTTDTDNDGKKDVDTNKDGTVDDCEAHEWVKKKNPSYTWTRNGKKYNPAGVSADGKHNPNPQKRSVGRDPKKININVQNATGANKTDFHIVFKGDVRGGFPIAWRSNVNDQINFGQRWARGPGKTQVGYDAEKDETMVCWIDGENPVTNGDYIHFGYRPPEGKNLKPLRQYWTPTNPVTPDPAESVPTQETTIEECEDCGTGGQEGVVIRSHARSAAEGGQDESVIVNMTYCVSPIPVPLEGLNLGNPFIQSLPPFTLFNGTLTPDVPVEIILTVPDDIPPGHTLIVKSVNSWLLNSNQTTSLYLYDPLAAQQSCWNCDGQGLGDGTGDGKNNYLDFSGVSSSWLTTSLDPTYRCCNDYNRDGSIGIPDLVSQAENFTRDDLGICDSAGICPPVCGDGVCDVELGETCETCDNDCGPCLPECGDDVCDPFAEDSVSCWEDCGPVPGGCGDGFCENVDGETCLTCPGDCPPCSELEIPAGEDCWTAGSCGETANHFSFCETPIPDDFFDPGSEPFVGRIELSGGSPDGIDTRISRLDEMYLPSGPASVQTEIQIVELNLVSCDPITVVVDGQDTQWDVQVTLTDDPPQPLGTMIVNKTHANGGVFAAEFFVKPVFTFTRVSNPADVRILDFELESLPPIQMGSTSAMPWIHHAEIDSGISGCSVNFIPGVGDPDQDATTNDQCALNNQVAGRFATMWLRTPNAPLCGVGACFYNSFCNDVPNAGACAGIYIGDGTSCFNNGDGDFIPDALESNDCCANPSLPGTDPKNPDTDGDGQLDGQDPNPCTPGTGGDCFNSIQDGLETDIDCGGLVCQPCPDGDSCNDNNDCVSLNCIDAICFPAEPGYCGDLVCRANEGEDDITCPADCSLTGICGDSVCNVLTETPLDCPTDCFGCGDAVCFPPETIGSCAIDCQGSAACGDGICTGAVENCHSCDQDCGTCDNTGDCCTETFGQASCSDPFITECVCSFDPFCCEVEWDSLCIQGATESCGAACTPVDVCGDGQATGSEVCDGSDLLGEDCLSQGFNGGTLACDPSCTAFDTSGCVSGPVCGDGTCDNGAGEACNTCPSDCGVCSSQECCVAHGEPGCVDPFVTDCVCASDTYCCEIAWDSTCMGEVTSLGCGTCESCGDGVANGSEVCDGSDLLGEDCITQGFLGGTLFCDPSCTSFDLSGCVEEVCGDGSATGTEACDGPDLRGEDCVSQGFLGGTLFCDPSCTNFDTSGCTGEFGD